MRIFNCSACRQPIYFDNLSCTGCGHILGFDAQTMDMMALQRIDHQSMEWLNPATQLHYKFCSNQHYGVCNWILPVDDFSPFCVACRVNRVIPNVSDFEYRQRWHKIELAKHRLIYSLLRWKLPVQSKVDSQNTGLAFDFKADPNCQNEPRVLTGHDYGLITLNIAEADDVERAMARDQMDEVYRTLLGHFRHEIGHYYWEILIAQTAYLEPYRVLFGDERVSYQDALNRHYREGPPNHWQEHYISAYASMHPWEDWAETWAHYLHIVDVLETVHSFGVQIHPQVVLDQPAHFMHLSHAIDPYRERGFDEIYQAWLPISFAMNSLNRSMGQEDFYPFVINQVVLEKLQFIHNVIQQQYHADSARSV